MAEWESELGSEFSLISFPDQRKKVGLGTCHTKVVLLQDFSSNGISCYTCIRCVDCANRERIHAAYMHQCVVDNMPVTWCYSIMESDKPFWIHAAHSSRTTLVKACSQTNRLTLVWKRDYVLSTSFRGTVPPYSDNVPNFICCAPFILRRKSKACKVTQILLKTRGFFSRARRAAARCTLL